MIALVEIRIPISHADRSAILKDLRALIVEALEIPSGTPEQTILLLLDCPDLVRHSHNDPLAVWRTYQSLLSDLYITASSVTYSLDQPLVEVTVILKDYCGYDPFRDFFITDYFGCGMTFPISGSINLFTMIQ